MGRIVADWDGAELDLHIFEEGGGGEMRMGEGRRSYLLPTGRGGGGERIGSPLPLSAPGWGWRSKSAPLGGEKMQTPLFAWLLGRGGHFKRKRISALFVSLTYRERRPMTLLSPGVGELSERGGPGLNFLRQRPGGLRTSRLFIAGSSVRRKAERRILEKKGLGAIYTPFLREKGEKKN